MQEQVNEEPAEQAPVEDTPQEATAPEEATTQIVTEATETEEVIAPQLAPTTSSRPRARPEKPQPVATAAAEPEPQAPAETQDTQSDAINDALASAIGEAAEEPVAEAAAAAPSGPPMTAGEKDALRVSVQKCWNVGSLSTEALKVTVTVSVTMQPDGRPDAASIRQLEFEGGSEAAAGQAYEAARRAIIRCGATGFDLPADKYDQWRVIEMVFNPERMRIK